MATHDQLRSLVKSHAEGDDSQFYAVTMQLAAKAARGGQSKFAKELRDLANNLRQEAKSTPSVPSVVPIAKPKGELSSLMTVTYPDSRLAALVWQATCESVSTKFYMNSANVTFWQDTDWLLLVGCC